MKEEMNHVRTLIRLAAECGDPHRAMQFAQAALNASHAVRTLIDCPPQKD